MSNPSDNKTWGDKLDDAIAHASTERRSARKVIRSDELTWEEDKMAKSALLISEMTGFSLRSIHAFIAEMPAGASTGKHRHTSEALMYGLSGSAYTIIDGERIDWKAGDAIAIPVMAWHQHFNASDTEPFRYLAASNYPMTVNLGVELIEHAESRSDLDES
ncbi:MAG: cupin domain-containing protein [Proteobacteria bacterium]|nr:MAG: cupin domain-containing protein [Pseudomonadota bacterium]